MPGNVFENRRPFPYHLGNSPPRVTLKNFTIHFCFHPRQPHTQSNRYSCRKINKLINTKQAKKS